MKRTENKYVRRTQKDYPMSFKISVVREYEETKVGLKELTRKYGIQGYDTIRKWINKFGTFDWQNLTLQPMAKTKDQELLELREKVKVLERKNARLEKELEQKDMKAEFLLEEMNLPFDIMKKAVRESVDIYNNKRPHCSCGYNTPEWTHGKKIYK